MTASLTGEPWTDGLPPARFERWTSELELFVTMRDGVRLSTDVYRPEGAEGPLPTVLVRTPYDKSRGTPGLMEQLFLRRGYAVVVQSERGRYFSEGRYAHYLEGARHDGCDTVDWIAGQPWSNGKVGTIGCSSTAEHQLPMAAENHPGHAAMIPMASGAAVGDVPRNDTRGAIYRGGIPLLQLWAAWYPNSVPAERLQLPADSTQEQRIRLRNTYSLAAKPQLRPRNPADVAKYLHLPTRDILREIGGALTAFDDFITWNGPGDPRWQEVGLLRGEDRPRVPSLHINTWHDIGVGEQVRLFEHLQELGTPDQYLILAPGSHCMLSTELASQLSPAELKQRLAESGATDLSALPEADFKHLKYGDFQAGDGRYRGVDQGYAQLWLRWFDKWLAGAENGVTDMPRVQLCIPGRGWIFGDRWPLPEVSLTPYYLSPDPESRLRLENGVLSPTPPPAAGSQTYVYDPGNPAPSLGGGCCDAAVAQDQRAFEARRDVLVFSTPPLTEPVTLAGPVEVVLHVSSTAVDTDFIVKLTDVHPDGRSINLNDDGFRLRYRDGFDKKLLMEPGAVCRIALPNMVVGHHFPPGHRIRLDISSSCFPLYERNLNTGGNNHDEAEWVVAENTVHLGGDHPSHVVLPVLPAEPQGRAQ